MNRNVNSQLYNQKKWKNPLSWDLSSLCVINRNILTPVETTQEIFNCVCLRLDDNVYPGKWNFFSLFRLSFSTPSSLWRCQKKITQNSCPRDVCVTFFFGEIFFKSPRPFHWISFSIEKNLFLLLALGYDFLLRFLDIYSILVLCKKKYRIIFFVWFLWVLEVLDIVKCNYGEFYLFFYSFFYFTLKKRYWISFLFKSLLYSLLKISNIAKKNEIE